MLRVGERVNLESPLTLTKPIGGHLVQGHIDELSRIRSIKKLEDSFALEVEYSPPYSKYLVPKGSVAIEGISFTVVNVFPRVFTVNLIPYTIEHTNLKYKTPGDLVNVEYDILAKYLGKIVGKF